jgi:hypothetical protein
MLNLITIVFADELSVLKMQAQSIDLYLDPTLIKDIRVVVNDDPAVASCIDKSWWGQFQDRVHIIPRQIYSVDFIDNGWHTQQLCKLLCAANGYNIWSMILDAKTLFVRPVVADHVFENQQPCVGHSLEIPSVFKNSQHTIEQLFGIKLDRQISPAGVPFIFHNSTVRNMIAHVENLTEQSFATWFQQNLAVTEFLLYSGFVIYKHKNFDHLYNQHKSQMRSINIAHCDIDQIDHKLSEMLLPEISTVSIHRYAWAQMSTDQQQSYQDLLAQRGIACEL